jgi:hypothetical protein
MSTLNWTLGTQGCRGLWGLGVLCFAPMARKYCNYKKKDWRLGKVVTGWNPELVITGIHTVTNIS